MFELSGNTILWLLLAGLVTGASKFSTGGMGMIILPVLMMGVPDKSALAVIIVMYVVTDILAVSTYRKHINWRVVVQVMPMALLGIVFGALVVKYIDYATFLLVLFLLTLLMLAFSLALEKYPVDVSRYPIIAYTVGAFSGFISMIGNAAGPVFNLYLLAVGGVDKQQFIGTRAWVFTLMNIGKGLGLYGIGLLSWDTVRLSMVTLPGVFVGAVIGFVVLQTISMTTLKNIIRVMIAIAACRLLYAYLQT